MPSFGRKRTSRASLRQTTAASWACSSFSEKYQWPEVASLRFEISPSTQTSRNSVSSTPWIRSVSSETVSARRRRASGFGAGGLREAAARAPRAAQASRRERAGSSPKSKPFWLMA